MMSSASPCSSASIPDDILYGDGNNKFVQQSNNANNNINATSTYLTQLAAAPVEISSTQTFKHFLAQKYAAESTSSDAGDANSAVGAAAAAAAAASGIHLPTTQSQFHHHQNTISNFYPFSPLVSSSSSHFDTRNILTDGLLESSIDSLQVESSTNANNTNTEQVSGHNSNHHHASIFTNNDNGLATTIENFIKQEEAAGLNLPPPVSTTPNVTSSSNRPSPVAPAPPGSNICRVEMVPSSLFDNVNSDITVDSTTTISISQTTNNINSTFPPLSFNNFQSPLHHQQQQSLPSVLTYGLSPGFSNALLQIDNSQPILPSLASPTIQSIDQYFNHHQQNGIEKKDEHVILDQNHHHLLQPSSAFGAENHCLISDNSLPDHLFHDIPNVNFSEADIVNLHENVINDLPVLSRARGSLPADHLFLQTTETGLGVFARKLIPKRTQFGPAEGVIVSLPPDNQYSPNSIAIDSKNSLIIFISETFILSQADENNSNWTRFVRPASNANEQNLELIAKEFCSLNEVKFYLYTTRNVMPNEELKIWYSNEYAQRFNIRLLGEVDPSNLLTENGSNLSKKDSPTVTLKNNVAAGHKLRNKIAKTQMTQNTLQISSQTNQLQGQEKMNGTHQEQQNGIQKSPPLANGKTKNAGEQPKPDENGEEKPKYQCNICQKIFPRHYSLRRHQVMHSGEKRHKCPFCGMAFNHVYNRNRHIRMHKTNEANNASSTNNKQNGSSKESGTAKTPPVAEAENSDSIPSNSNVMAVKKTPVVFKQLIVSLTSQTATATPDTVLVDSHSGSISNETRSPSTDSSDSDDSDSDSNQTKEDSIKSEIVSSSGLDAKSKLNSNISGGSKTFRCSQCYKRFSTKERLEKHGIVHDESAKKLSCPVCDRKFLTNSALTCHIKYHKFSNDEPRKYDCTLCDKVFDSIQSRREHVSVHINPDSGLFHCPKCPKTFDDFSIIRKHLKSFHSNEIFPCAQCPKVFPRQDKLRLHMLCHIDRWEFKCNFCEKQFKRKDKLKEHTQRMHAPDRDVRIAAARIAARMQRVKVQRTRKVATKPSQPNYQEFVFKCHLCLFGFKRRGMLVNHLAKRHPDVPYNSVPELNMPIVKTSKDYYCQYCEKVYKSSSKRKAHIIKNHPGKTLPPSNRNKAVNHDVNQSFSATVGSITMNPHFCDWCHKQYASKAKLMQHQRKKHPEKISNSTPRQSSKSSSQNSNGMSKTAQNNPNPSSAGMYKLNTIISGNKATFTTVPITPEAVKSKIPMDNQMMSVEANKIDQFLSQDSPQTYMDGFNMGNHLTKDNGTFLNGTTVVQAQEAQVPYTIDSTDPSFEELLNINIGPDVNHNLNTINNSTSSDSSFNNNVITILGTTTFNGDLSEFSDIMTQISEFQNGKQMMVDGNNENGVLTESSSADMLISGTIDENNWNQVCEEMAIV